MKVIKVRCTYCIWYTSNSIARKLRFLHEVASAQRLSWQSNYQYQFQLKLCSCNSSVKVVTIRYFCSSFKLSCCRTSSYWYQYYDSNFSNLPILRRLNTFIVQCFSEAKWPTTWCRGHRWIRRRLCRLFSTQEMKRQKLSLSFFLLITLFLLDLWFIYLIISFQVVNYQFRIWSITWSKQKSVLFDPSQP